MKWSYTRINKIIYHYREKRREREREDLWKKLNDLEISSRSNNKINENNETQTNLQHQQQNYSSNPTSTDTSHGYQSASLGTAGTTASSNSGAGVNKWCSTDKP